MFRKSTLALIVFLLLAGCGGNTSWYFCSGSDEFCSADRRIDDGHEDDEDKDEEQAVTASALSLSRKIPQVVQDGLAVDALQTALVESPEVVAGWLIAGSIGALADDTDDATLSAFLDANRYWLTVNDNARVDNPEMLTGLRLLTSVATTRDPQVAAAANRLISGSDAPMVLISEDVDAVARPLVAGAVDSQCCQTSELMAAAVLLCGQLIESGSTQATTPSVSAACASAERWLSAYSAGSVR